MQPDDDPGRKIGGQMRELPCFQNTVQGFSMRAEFVGSGETPSRSAEVEEEGIVLEPEEKERLPGRNLFGEEGAVAAGVAVSDAPGDDDFDEIDFHHQPDGNENEESDIWRGDA